MYFKINKQDLMLQFERNGRESFRRAIEEQKQNGIIHLVIPYAKEITVAHLQALEPKMDSILKDCGSLTNLMEKLWEILGPIPGINQSVINNNALLYAYIHDLDNDADCESLITDQGKVTLEELGIDIEEIRAEIRKMGKDALSKRALVYFINQLNDKQQDYKYESR